MTRDGCGFGSLTGQHTRRRFVQAAGGSIALGASGCLGFGSDPEANVEEYRSELEQFGDVATAMDREFRTLARYVETDDGVLGEPLMADRSGDPVETEPNVVTFDFAPDGTYEPLALKWFVPAEKADEAPSLFGRSFDGPVESPNGVFPRHYYLNVWLFRENPDGLFARYHPDVDPEPFLADVETARDTMEQYAISTDAVKVGYSNPEVCASTDGGVYGVPFLKDPGGGTDLADPPILRYRLTSSWSYVLLGAEWHVPADELDEPPELFGQQFHDPMDGHLAESEQPRHYGLHAWLFRSNPNGLFAPFNPAISCG